jgi:hypothetical protein
MAPAASVEPVIGAVQGERQGLQQPQLQQSQQQPPADASSTKPVRAEINRFIPGFLSFGIEPC